MSDSPIELIAVQPHMQLADYRTVDAFDGQDRGADRSHRGRPRARRARTSFACPRSSCSRSTSERSSRSRATAISPPDGDDVDAILRRVVAPAPAAVSRRRWCAHRTSSPSAAVLLMESGKMHPRVSRAFRDAARRLRRRSSPAASSSRERRRPRRRRAHARRQPALQPQATRSRPTALRERHPQRSTWSRRSEDTLPLTHRAAPTQSPRSRARAAASAS